MKKRDPEKSSVTGPLDIDPRADEDDHATEIAISALLFAEQECADAEREIEEVSSRLPLDICRKARVVSGFNIGDDGEPVPMFLESPEAIDNAVSRWKECINAAGADQEALKTADAFGANLHRDLERDAEMLAASSERLGLQQVIDRYNAASRARTDAIVALGIAQPATLRSAHLLAQFVAQKLRDGEPPETYGTAVAALERSLSRMAHDDRPYSLQS